MKLTGKAKELFEEWYNQSDWIAYGKITDTVFHALPESMRWGVYQDWADSLGEELYISKDGRGWFWALDYRYSDGYAESLPQARNAALASLNDLINQTV